MLFVCMYVRKIQPIELSLSHTYYCFEDTTTIYITFFVFCIRDHQNYIRVQTFGSGITDEIQKEKVSYFENHQSTLICIES